MLLQIKSDLQVGSFSYQSIDTMLVKMNNTGYPYALLEEFTLPLLQSKIFKTVFFRENYKHSLDTTVGHDVALGNDIHVEYLP